MSFIAWRRLRETISSVFRRAMDEVQKGYFPYRFYTPETEHYVGPLPEKHYYGLEHTSVKELNISK